MRSIASNQVKPALGGASMGVTAVSLTAGQIRVGLPADYDDDDVTLTYRLYRDGGGTPVAQASVDSRASRSARQAPSRATPLRR